MMGLAKMDNGEIAAAGTVVDPSKPVKGLQAAIMITKDLGATWSDYHLIEDFSFARVSAVRPMMLAYTTCCIGWDTDALCLVPSIVRLILGYRPLLKKHFGNDRADTARTS